MKKVLLTALICMGATVQAFAEPEVYGKANVSFQSADESGESVTELVSNASRLGVRGSEEIDYGLEAIYQLEFEVAIDDGDSGGETFSQRNIFAGLKTDFGTIKGGKIDTPLKVVQKKIDLFNDLEGDIKSIITVNDNRANNIVIYSLPSSIEVFSASLAYIASEDPDVDDGYSASVGTEFGGLYLGLAADQSVEEEDAETVRFIAQYNIADFQFGALYEEFDPALGDTVEGFVVSAQYKLNDWAFKVQGGESDIIAEGGETLSLGVDYKFTKTFKTFAYYTTEKSDNDVVDNDYLGAGMELKF